MTAQNNDKKLLDPRNHSPQDFISEVEQSGINSKNSRRLFAAVIGRGVLSPKEWAKEGIISKNKSLELEELAKLKLEKVETSKIDGFKKLLFRTHDNLAIETVIIPLEKENTVTLCLSSQVGCVMGCTFCATAKMKDRRNLKSWEILDQVREARKIVKEQGKNITGIVFMGMGEPFLNYENVLRSAEILCFPVINAIGAKSITISTVGILDKITKFIDEDRKFRLSISIGAPSDEKRKKLVPIAAKTPISKIMAEASRYALKRNDRVMLAYVCISKENMYEEDAIELAKVIGDTKVRLDLIEVTDTSNLYKTPTEKEFNKFRDYLNQHLKQPIIRRYSGGRDINAGCGTLAGK